MLWSRRRFLALLIPLGIATAALAAGRHDFTTSTTYPNLRNLNGGFCAGCHTRRVHGFGNDFPGGVAVVTDPTYRVGAVGPRRNPSLFGAMKCLECHDGVMPTPTGTDRMPTPDPWSTSLNLDWSVGGAHNIWGMGQDSAYHPVEIHYPPDPDEKMWAGFTTLTINGDNNRQLVNGAWWIVDPALCPKGLPLVTDPADAGKGYISCVTCHDGHDATGTEDFLRAGWPNLCFMCHRRAANAARGALPGEPAPGDREGWKRYLSKLSTRPKKG